MPQVHNKSLVMEKDVSAFGKNSRAGASLRFTETSLRRIEAMNGLEQKLNRISINYFERHADIQKRKYQRARQRILENYHKTMAYKLVLKSHSIAKAKDYKKALDGNYSFHAFRHKVKDMMEFIQPENIREVKARNLISENRKRYDRLIKENRDACDVIFPRKKSWEAFDFNKVKTSEEEEEEAASDKGSTVSPLPNIGQIRGSRPNLIMGPKRQGITMSMMKKQRSFIEAQDRLTPRVEEENKENPSSNTEKSDNPPSNTDDKITEERNQSEPADSTLEGAVKDDQTLPKKSVNKKGGVNMKPRYSLPPVKLKKVPTRRESIQSLR